MRHAGPSVEAAPARLAFGLGSRPVEVANIRREWRTYMMIREHLEPEHCTGPRDGGPARSRAWRPRSTPARMVVMVRSCRTTVGTTFFGVAVARASGIGRSV